MSRVMKLYAAASHTRRTREDGGIDIRTLAFPVRAHSNYEAVGIAYEVVQSDYPSDDGWTNRQVVVSHIPRSFWPKGTSDVQTID